MLQIKTNKPNIWFTADLHLGHLSIIPATNRPFESIEEMDEVLLNNYNSRVGLDDMVIIVGDVSFHRNPERNKQILMGMNGKKILVLGNHDKKLPKGCFTQVTDILELIVNGNPIIVCHYAMRIWPKSHYGAWHLFGHSHGHTPPCGKSFDIGVDSGYIPDKYYPISYEEVVSTMATMEQNSNYIIKKGVSDEM